MSQYTSTTILDCNRRHSSEAKSGNEKNPALFTNELGMGVELNVGDKVSVQGVYISEVGAGADTIEIKGQSLDKMRKIKYTAETKAYPNIRNFDSDVLPFNDNIENFNEIRSETKELEYEVKDNETYITKQYYLTLNGEGSYFSFPRNYIDNIDPATTNASVTGKFTQQNDYSNGNMITNGFNNFSFCNADYQIIQGGGGASAGTASYEASVSIMRMKHDNSKMTLLRSINASYSLNGNFTIWNSTTNSFTDIVSARNPNPNPNPGQDGRGQRDPMQDNSYDYYQEIQKISVDPGFNSPVDIARSITAQLKEADPVGNYEQQIINASHSSDPVRKQVENFQMPVTLTLQNKCYKSFLCSSAETMTEGFVDTFVTSVWSDTTIPNASDISKITDYYSNFYNIYCKRPELRIVYNASGGREVLSPFSIKVDIPSTGKMNDIVLDLEYNEVNLTRLSLFIDAEELYPELFKGGNFSYMTRYAKNIRDTANPEDLSFMNTRFLHAGIYNNTTLGTDNLNVAPGASDPEGLVTAGEVSLPLFFEYQYKNKGKYIAEPTDNNRSFGFANKVKIGDDYFVSLSASYMGGINPLIVDDTLSNQWDIATSLVGYDYHATGYGSCYVMGFNGRLTNSYGDYYKWGVGGNPNAGNDQNLSWRLTAGLLRQMYVGAENPVLEYDTEKSRFYWGQLHSAQVIGQDDYNAGAVYDTSNTPADKITKSIPDLTSEQGQGLPVYKINKRINKYTFSPDMCPYESEINASLAILADTGNPFPPELATHTTRTFSLQNRNITPYTIFDSMSGIYITDLGYDSDTFSNGLFGLLGFTHANLFSQESGNNNRLVRINNTNINRLSLITTNADIVSTDLKNFNVNPYGAVMFTNQIPSPVIINNGGIGYTSPQYTIFPAITQSTESIKVYANNLPRKMLKPYYCIRSDIIDTLNYVGGEDSQSKLPVVSICDKQYSGGDFYFNDNNTITFTITKKKTISSITTSIHDPDQSFAHVDLDSSVIYRIDKLITNDTNLAEELLNSPRK